MRRNETVHFRPLVLVLVAAALTLSWVHPANAEVLLYKKSFLEALAEARAKLQMVITEIRKPEFDMFRDELLKDCIRWTDWIDRERPSIESFRGSDESFRLKYEPFVKERVDQADAAAFRLEKIRQGVAWHTEAKRLVGEREYYAGREAKARSGLTAIAGAGKSLPYDTVVRAKQLLDELARKYADYQKSVETLRKHEESNKFEDDPQDEGIGRWEGSSRMKDTWEKVGALRTLVDAIDAFVTETQTLAEAARSTGTTGRRGSGTLTPEEIAAGRNNGDPQANGNKATSTNANAPTSNSNAPGNTNLASSNANAPGNGNTTGNANAPGNTNVASSNANGSSGGTAPGWGKERKIVSGDTLGTLAAEFARTLPPPPPPLWTKPNGLVYKMHEAIEGHSSSPNLIYPGQVINLDKVRASLKKA